MPDYQVGSKGLDVTRLEIRLKELGLYNKGLDDTFGPGLQAAVKTFQQQKGLPVTGIVDNTTWQALFADPSPCFTALKDKETTFRSLALTAGFETSATVPDCFCGLVGDFDGQGMSFGVLQWNLGQGTLQPMLREMDTKFPDVVKKIFGDGYASFKQMLAADRATQLEWARSKQDAQHRLIEPWKSRFRDLGRASEYQDLQLEGVKDYLATARQLCTQYGLWSERGLALMFDIAVQNGSIKAATRQKILDDFNNIAPSLTREEQEVERMRIIANRRAEASDPRFVEDVRQRKLAIVNGVGIVHDVGYDVERQYGLNLQPIA